MLKLGILCSGGLGYEILNKMVDLYNVKFVLTDKGSESIIKFCEEKELPYFAGNPRNGKGFDFIKNIKVDIIASINYLFLIEEDIINHPDKMAFNIHGSLLPKYRGRTPHVWAIINDEKETGITAHKIEVGCDTGDIIEQIRIPIENDDTGAKVLSKYAAKYFPLIKKVLNKIGQNDFNLIPQDENKATYFGKRTPKDGEINWNWQRARIRNWVRAQSNPYPGAFTFYNEEKVIIDEVKYSDFGFDSKIENGTIIKVKPHVLVKTSNGVLALTNIRSERHNFVEGKKMQNENR